MWRRVAIALFTLAIVVGCADAGSKEAELRNNLFALRSSITQYTMDKQEAPQSLNQLVEAGYLREVPADPMTQKRDWEVIMEDVYLMEDQTQPGIYDVRSRSTATSTEGTPYNSW